MSKSDKDSDKDSVYLSYLLRHHPESANLQIDSFGYVSITELIRNTGGRFNRDKIVKIVADDNKNRYSFNEEETKIRANQGHSIKGINPGLVEKLPPDILYHGTSRKNLVLILDSQMIKPMSRNLVHLSSDEDTALKVGKRRDDKPAIILIDAAGAHRDKIKFYLSENGVWLTKYVDVKYVYDIKYT